MKSRRVLACTCGEVEHNLDFGETSVMAFRLEVETIRKIADRDTALCNSCFAERYIASRENLREVVYGKRGRR